MFEMSSGNNNLGERLLEDPQGVLNVEVRSVTARQGWLHRSIDYTICLQSEGNEWTLHKRSQHVQSFRSSVNRAMPELADFVMDGDFEDELDASRKTRAYLSQILDAPLNARAEKLAREFIEKSALTFGEYGLSLKEGPLRVRISARNMGKRLLGRLIAPVLNLFGLSAYSVVDIKLRGQIFQLGILFFLVYTFSQDMSIAIIDAVSKSVRPASSRLLDSIPVVLGAVVLVVLVLYGLWMRYKWHRDYRWAVLKPSGLFFFKR
jgi:hypothetical protein